MRRLVLVALCSAILLVVLQPSATAEGGWWSSLQLYAPYLGVGESVTVRSEVMFETIQAAEEARQTRYFAYLVHGNVEAALERALSKPDPGDWWQTPKKVILAGTVELSRWDANLVQVAAFLHIPEIVPGHYYLMLCDAACRNPLADLVPRPVHVSSDAVAAKTARRLYRTNERLDLALREIRRDLRRDDRRLEVAEETSGASAKAVALLERRISRIESRPSSVPWLPYAAIFLGGIAVALVAGRNRRGRNPLVKALAQGIPDDASEIDPITRVKHNST